MIKNFFRIPNIFDPDDRRRRQTLNILLIVFIVMCLAYFIAALISYNDQRSSVLIGWLVSTLVVLTMLFANRSPRVPGWLTGIVFVAVLIAIISGADSADQLYNGRSLITWVLPIMVGAVVLAPESVFVIVAVIFGFIQIFAPVTTDAANYYAMMILLVVAFVSWLGMSIANRAIRDARREAANMQAIYNHVADGVLVINLQGEFSSANPALLKMIPEEDLQELLTQPLGKTIHWRRKIFTVTTSEIPEVGTVAVFRDETRRHETERARDALLATASHELRTPLTAVMNYLEFIQVLIKTGNIKSDEFNEHVARALENVKRLQNLVNDILDHAQIQAGALNLKNEPFNLRSLIEKAYQLLEVLLEQKNLSYDLEIAPDVPAEISGDSSRLHQVLVNLIGNAIKFTNQGGIRVNISTPLKERLSIEVVDSGPGIPPEQLPDIFEAFRRGSDYVQREQQGAGLGLSIAKEIVTHMGGEISVSSEPGNGSIFTILLPMDAA